MEESRRRQNEAEAEHLVRSSISLLILQMLGDNTMEIPESPRDVEELVSNNSILGILVGEIMCKHPSLGRRESKLFE